MGRKHDPSFRIVLTDSKNATKSGKFLEVLGAYNARFGTPAIKNERVLYWLSKGAQASDTVHNLLISAKVIEGKKINVLPKKTVPVKAEEPVKAKEAVVATEAPVTEAVTEIPAEDTAVAPEEALVASKEEPAEESSPALAEITEEKPTE